MAATTPQAEAQSLSWPPPTSHSIDENSPLLRNTSYRDFAYKPSGDGETYVVRGKELATSSLIWIMMSVWIGSFTAGLGEHLETPDSTTNRLLLIQGMLD